MKPGKSLTLPHSGRLFALLVAASTFASASGIARSARAESTAPDEVVLKDGTAVRGTLISVDNGDKVVILKQGAEKTTTLAWKDVSDIEKGKYAPAKDAKPGSAGNGYKETADPDKSTLTADKGKPGVVKLHIDSPIPVSLMRVKPLGYVSAGGYQMGVTKTDIICAAPCDRVVDSSDGARYLLAGSGFGPETLPLAQHQGDVTAKVDPGSPAGRTIGGIGVVGGVTGVITGGLLAGLGAAADEKSVTKSLTKTGLVTLGISGAVLVGGIVIKILSTDHVKLESPAGKAGPDHTAEVKPRYWMGEF